MNSMRAAFITQFGNAQEAFEIREIPIPEPGKGELCIKVEAFGLNFAEVVARMGLYREAPPLPFVPGYDCVGRITSLGPGMDDSLLGKRVAAMARFGTYAEYCITRAEGIIEIPEDMDAAQAAALCVQYTTAYYAACHSINLLPGDRVLIHAAAGGVGMALVQLCLWKGCEIYATAGSEEKIEKLKKAGVQHVANYLEQDYETVFGDILGKNRLDAAFNAIAGKSYKKDRRLLGAGGRIVIYGASERTKHRVGKWHTYKLLWDMGIQLPILLMAKSQAIIGVNILKIADYKPQVIRACTTQLMELLKSGVINPQIGHRYSIDQLAQAHEDLEKRKTSGKVVVLW